ncbi:class I SAM-dependent methyltransferase [Actinophytocola sp. KF-1]
MPTQPAEPAPETHRLRDVAESFGADAERYDRTRPTYPDAMIERIVAAGPGRDLVDVGCGTGIAARQFQAAGARVLGVEIDPRMAEVARRAGIDVEVSPFESWRTAGRTFDIVTAGQTWHWIDPAEGAAKAAEALRPGGLLAVFWNVAVPPADLSARFADVYRRVLPGAPAYDAAKQAGGYTLFLDRAADGIRPTNAFAEPERWRFEWTQPYTKDEWLDQVPTFGGNTRLPRETLAAVLSGMADAIDGDGFTMSYTTLVLAAVRTG